MYMFYEGKKSARWRIEPRTSCRKSSHLNPFASSADANLYKVKVSIYNSTWRFVTYVWRRTSRPPSPSHHVSGPSLDMDLLKAEIGGEAGLETMEEQPTT